jgi:hypothetical protein
MNYVRLKTDLKPICLEDRLQYQPEIIEFHLETYDLKNPDRIRNAIHLFQKAGSCVYLHHPTTYKEKKLDIISQDPTIFDYYTESSILLAQLCKEEGVRCVIHANYTGNDNSSNITQKNIERVKERISFIRSLEGGENFLWEDSIMGIFSQQNPRLFQDIIKPLSLDVNLDISHSFIALKGNNNKLIETIQLFYPYIHYFHVVDSLGLEHDSLPLGKGRIDWKRIVPFIQSKPFIFEIGLEPPYDDCSLMMDSVRYFHSIMR